MLDKLASIENEQLALVHYLINCDPGPSFKNAAELRIKQLQQLKEFAGHVADQRLKHPHNSVSCINTRTGIIYESMQEAADDISINANMLRGDIAREEYFYKIVPIKNLL